MAAVRERVYITGWFQRRFKVKQLTRGRYAQTFSALAALLVLVSLLSGYGSSSFALCVRELRAGLPQTVLREYNQRLEVLKGDGDTATLARYSVRSDALMPWNPQTPDELSSDDSHWVNRAVAAYYGKKPSPSNTESAG